jgi:hypothetical protein
LSQIILGMGELLNNSKKAQFSKYLTRHIAKKESGLIITNTRIGDKSSIAGGSYHIPHEE